MLYDIEQLRTLGVTCADYDADNMWALSERIKGLYKVSRKDNTTECLLDAEVMAEYPVSYFLTVVKYKNKVFLVPKGMDQEWLVYDLAEGNVSYKRVFSESANSEGKMFLGAVVVDSVLWLVSTDINEPIYAVGLEGCIVEEIHDWTAGIEENFLEAYEGGVTWKCVVNKPYIYFPIRLTSYLVRINTLTKQVDVIDVACDIEIKDIDCVGEDIWILPNDGNSIYKWEDSTRIIKAIPGNVVDACVCQRIAAYENGVVLIPKMQSEIMIYDNKKRRWKLIDVFPEGFLIYSYVRSSTLYWHYYKEGDFLYISAWQANMFLCIDTKNWEVTGNIIQVPSCWSDEMIRKQWAFSIYNEVMEEFMYENKSKVMGDYIVCLDLHNKKDELKKNNEIGEEIFYSLMNEEGDEINCV